MTTFREQYVLAVDLGTSGCKAALVSVYGKVIGWEFESVDTLLFPNGGAEQDPQSWWNAFLRVAKRLIAQGLVPASEIIAICCSTQGECTVPVDTEGRPLMNAILWMDARGREHLRAITGGPIMVAGFHPLRLLRWIRLTGGAPSTTGKDPASHMLFIKHEFPEVYQRTHKFLNVLDYLNFRLTGKLVATFDSILTSWVTDNRDVENVVYSDSLLRGCGIDREKFPEIVKCTEVIGSLDKEVAEALGLTTDIVRHMASFSSAVRGKYVLLNNQTTAGGNLSFIAENVVYHKDALLQEEKRPDLYKVFDKVCAKVPPGSNGLLYSPWIFGERSPVDDHFIRGGIHNVSLHNNREDIVRAVFEGVAFNAKWLLQGVSSFLKRHCDTLRMSRGGGAASDVWCQIHADILDRRILQVHDPIRSNARAPP